MKTLGSSSCLVGVLLLVTVAPAWAQYAPTPQKAPRTPVSKELVAGKATPLPPGHMLEGEAIVQDAERLRIGDVEIRLFGVVPPQMGATLGPQARAVVDSLAQGTTSCQIKDRTRDGNYLALCHNAAKADFGLELLRRGLAATARGSLRATLYAEPYLAAEQAAQSQRLGIWAAALPAAASESSIREVMNAKTEAEKAKAEETARAEAAAKAAAEAEKARAEAAARAEAERAKEEAEKARAEEAAKVAAQTTRVSLAPALDVAPVLSAPHPVVQLNATPALPTASGAPQGFFERYQLLLTGLLAFATAVVFGGLFAWNTRRQKREDVKSVAAALHGELMAARSVCQARLAKIMHEGTDKNTTWPKIRVLVFQAYVGRIGCLGAELSRQVASIYGMASDYASYYNTVEPRAEGTSKRQALEALVQYIEEISPRLSAMEREGCVPRAPKPVAFGVAALHAPKARPLPLAGKKPSLATETPRASATPTPPPDGPGRPSPVLPPEPTRSEETGGPSIASRLSEAKTEIMSDPVSPNAPRMRVKAPQTTAQKQTDKTPVSSKAKETLEHAARHTRESAMASMQKLRSALDMDAALKSVAGLNLKAPIIERLSKLKDRATKQKESGIIKPRPAPQAGPDINQDDFTIPDYANLTEEELEALLYAEEEMILASPVGKSHRAG